MSRGVRDLRDLICVSRLSVRESDEDELFSDDNLMKFGRENSLTSTSSTMAGSKPNSPTNTVGGSRVISPDSGFTTNGSPGVSNSTGSVFSADNMVSSDSFFIATSEKDRDKPLQPGTARFQSQKKKKKKRVDKLPLEAPKHELPKPSPLPPVQQTVLSSSVHDLGSETSANLSASSKNARRCRINFDDMMIYLDATIVATWLTRANSALQDLTIFCRKGDNFVHFAHFWLSEFPDLQKRDIFRMEYDILLDELTLAFTVGKENGKVVRRDILDLCGAIFKEYPLKLLSVKGSHIFLNYLDLLTSEKQDQYKALLSDVRCSTVNRQFAQWLLATRSFALVNVWSSIINFFRNLSQGLQYNPVHDLWSSKEKVPIRRMLQAIRLGFIEVIHYLITNGHVDPSHTDSHGRTLIFSAVMHNQVDTVKYLSKRVQPPIDINVAADTGNTPLHAACNNGHLPVVDLLCQCDDINVNCLNSQCENVTPLHLAVMHGHTKIVECLLKHGADPTLLMGSTTVYDLAKDFEHHDIQQLLQNK